MFINDLNHAQDYRDHGISLQKPHIPKFIYEKQVKTHRRYDTGKYQNTSSKKQIKRKTFEKENSNKSLKKYDVLKLQSPKSLRPSIDETKRLSLGSCSSSDLKQLKFKKQNNNVVFNNVCINHSTRDAQFQLVWEQNDKMIYCSRCAAQLASQGFLVKKLYNLNNPTSYLQTQIHQSIKKQEIKQHIEGSIKSFLKQINQVKDHHLEILSKYLKVQEVYSEQIQLLDSFYQTILETVQLHREQHLQRLNVQCLDIVTDHERQVKYLKKSINEIDGIITDIKTNFQEILENMGEQEFKSCFSCYEHTVSILKSRIEQNDLKSPGFPSYETDKLQLIINSINHQIQTLVKINNPYSTEISTKPNLITKHIRRSSNSFQKASLKKITINQIEKDKLFKKIGKNQLFEEVREEEEECKESPQFKLI